MEHETITACENICRDFSWLGEWMPAAIAASTALLIAFVAYPWQKRKDRELQKESERREVYRLFWEATNEHFTNVHRALTRKDLTGLNVSHSHVVAKSAGIVIYASSTKSNNSLEACRRFYQRLLEYETQVKAACGDEFSKKYVERHKERYPKDLYSQLKQERKKALISIRRDLGESEDTAKKAADTYFVLTPREEEQ